MSLDIRELQVPANYHTSQRTIQDIDLKNATMELMRQIEILGDVTQKLESFSTQANVASFVVQDNWCQGYEAGRGVSYKVSAELIREQVSALMEAQQQLAQVLKKREELQ